MILLAFVASVVASLRWLRVSQREHYVPGWVTRFAWRWWRLGWNAALGVAAVLAAVASIWVPASGLLTLAVVAFGPIGLGLRGRTSALAWTARLRRLAAITAALLVVMFGVTVALRTPYLSLWVAMATPIVVDLALLIAQPLERRLSERYVGAATRRLATLAPQVVAITGSYGKTTTKGYLGALLRRHGHVVVSPASFNNRLGLARAINEQLASGTKVFVAEMGTYGKGEIAEMCRWIRPTVSVITAIGPVHLERFGSIEAIAEAKSEIAEPAEVLVVNVDDPLLGDLAARESTRRTVIRCSTSDPSADVAVVGDTVYVSGRPVAGATAVFPSNLACAVGAAVALGYELSAEDFGSMPLPPHRQTVAETEAGVVVIDDTYNANPEGARRALETLASLGTGRRIVVTPGMVELGLRQYRENAAFAAAAADVADELVIVGRTNRRALESGAGGRLPVRVVATREEAVAWVRSELGPGDAVLYENDLPDHYP